MVEHEGGATEADVLLNWGESLPLPVFSWFQYYRTLVLTTLLKWAETCHLRGYATSFEAVRMYHTYGKLLTTQVPLRAGSGRSWMEG